jgi:hypothetical protein
MIGRGGGGGGGGDCMLNIRMSRTPIEPSHLETAGDRLYTRLSGVVKACSWITCSEDDVLVLVSGLSCLVSQSESNRFVQVLSVFLKQ